MTIYALFSTSLGRYVYKLTNEGKLRWIVICSVDYLMSMRDDSPKILCYKIDYDSWVNPKYIEFKEEHLQNPLVEI